MNTHELVAWVEANPGKSVLIGGGGVIFLLWVFGAFSKPAAADNGGGLAAAYYAAEAQQAVVGGQIQMANIAASASTAQALIGANAATTINQQQGAVVSHLGDLQLSATLSNNDTLLKGTQITTQAQLDALNAGIQGSEALAFINTIVPQEIAMTGGWGNFRTTGGQELSVSTGSPVGDPNAYLKMGFTPEQANAIALQTAGLRNVSPPIPAYVAPAPSPGIFQSLWTPSGAA